MLVSSRSPHIPPVEVSPPRAPSTGAVTGTGACRSVRIIAAGYSRETRRTNPDDSVVRNLQPAHNERYPEVDEVSQAGPLFVLVALASGTGTRPGTRSRPIGAIAAGWPACSA